MSFLLCVCVQISSIPSSYFSWDILLCPLSTIFSLPPTCSCGGVIVAPLLLPLHKVHMELNHESLGRVEQGGLVSDGVGVGTHGLEGSKDLTAEPVMFSSYCFPGFLLRFSFFIYIHIIINIYIACVLWVVVIAWLQWFMCEYIYICIF